MRDKWWTVDLKEHDDLLRFKTSTRQIFSSRKVRIQAPMVTRYIPTQNSRAVSVSGVSHPNTAPSLSTEARDMDVVLLVVQHRRLCHPRVLVRGSTFDF